MRDFDLKIVEDCAQAHGARYEDKMVGSIGHIGAWSYCQDKIMTTGGEGGMVTTDDPQLADQINMLRNHGASVSEEVRHHGPAPQLAHRVFRWMMDTIEYHPAGTAPTRVICFSPHPDDDVISMGGTLIRLIEDGHEVHIAQQFQEIP